MQSKFWLRNVCLSFSVAYRWEIWESFDSLFAATPDEENVSHPWQLWCWISRDIRYSVRLFPTMNRGPDFQQWAMSDCKLAHWLSSPIVWMANCDNNLSLPSNRLRIILYSVISYEHHLYSFFYYVIISINHRVHVSIGFTSYSVFYNRPLAKNILIQKIFSSQIYGSYQHTVFQLYL